MTPLLKINEVSKLLAVSVRTVKRMIASGELPHVRFKTGGQLRFDPREVEKFIEQHKS